MRNLANTQTFKESRKVKSMISYANSHLNHLISNNNNFNGRDEIIHLGVLFCIHFTRSLLAQKPQKFASYFSHHCVMTLYSSAYNNWLIPVLAWITCCSILHPRHSYWFFFQVLSARMRDPTSTQDDRGTSVRRRRSVWPERGWALIKALNWLKVYPLT